jgi:hypothetical protein
MKTTVKILVGVSLLGTMMGCKTTFNATKTLQVEQNRNAIYQEIISNPVQLSNFISQAQKNEEAKKLLMKAQMEQMESGNMQMMMDKNPEMMEKMQSHMQMMMDKNPEMMEKMQSHMQMMMDKNPEMMGKMQSHMQMMMDKNPEMMKMMQSNMLDKMMDNEMGRHMLMDKIHTNSTMKEEMKEKMMQMMKEKMMQMMNENPEMMEENDGKNEKEKLKVINSCSSD